MLVGRAAERQALARLLAAARLGDSGVLVLSGDPGIGKTTLLTAVIADAGMRVLSTRGVAAEREIAFAGLHQLCAPLLPTLERLPPPQAAALGVALAVRSGPIPEPFAVGAAVLGLLTLAAEEAPLAILVDDVHLLDQSSAQAIAFAARRLVSDPVAVIMTARSGEASAMDDLPRLDLGPLTIGETADLLDSTDSGQWDHGRLVRFHGATGGNPLAILELAAEADRLGAAPPDAPVALTGELLAAYSRRIHAISPDARAVLLLAATDSHDTATLARACAAAGLDLGMVAEAETAGLVRLTDAAVEFRHPLVRAAVYGDADAAERREAHRRLAAAIEPDELDRRAWHRAEAAVGPEEEAAELLALAANESINRGANAVASAQLERSATLTQDQARQSDRLLQAGEQAWLAGASQRAMVLLDQAMRIARTPLERSRVRGRQGAIAARGGSLEDARDLLLTAADEASAADPEAAALLLTDAVETSFYLCDARSALAASERLAALDPTEIRQAVGQLGWMAAGIADILGGQADRGTALIRASLAASAEPAEVNDQWRYSWTLVGPLFLRETGQARRRMDDAVRLVRAKSAVGMLPFLLSLVARDDATSDRWQDAEAGYTEAIRLAAETGHTTDRALALSGLAWLEARQGREAQCRGHAATALRIGTANRVHLARVWASHALADLEAALGNAVAAATAYESLQRMLGELHVTDADLWPAPELVECYRQSGSLDRMLPQAQDFLARATAKGQPWALARAHRTMAIAGADDDAEAYFLRAMELHALTPDPFEQARSRLAFGSWLRRVRRRVDARLPLRAALAEFERLGATPWADRAATELAATGEHARRRDATATTALTPQERQIATMLTAGRTTREAATALFLSPKTVEYHLRNVYLKLGIRSRDELARAMEV